MQKNTLPPKWKLKRYDDSISAYHVLRYGDIELTVEPLSEGFRRGNFVAKGFKACEKNQYNMLIKKYFPRFYYDIDNAKRELEAWLYANEVL